MPNFYNQYIYKSGAWRQIGVSSDSITYQLSLSGDTLTLTGSDGSTTTVQNFGRKTTVTTATISAAGWSGSTYSALQTLYPASSYDIEIEPNGDSCTSAQYAAWGAAQLVGSATTNVLTALGTVPAVDIPIIIKVTDKS
jgi:hypothetical protein